MLANVSGDIGGPKVLSIYRHFSPADNVFRTQKNNSIVYAYQCRHKLSEVRNGALKYDSRAPIVPHPFSFRLCSVVIRDLPVLVWRPRPLVLQ